MIEATLAAYLLGAFAFAVYCRILDKKDEDLRAYLAAMIMGFGWPFVAVLFAIGAVAKTLGGSDEE